MLRYQKFYFQPHVICRLLCQSITRPSLLLSYWTGFVMLLLQYLKGRARLVESANGSQRSLSI